MLDAAFGNAIIIPDQVDAGTIGHQIGAPLLHPR